MDRLPQYICVKQEKPIEIIDDFIKEYCLESLNKETSNDNQYFDLTEDDIETEMKTIETEVIVISDSEDDDLVIEEKDLLIELPPKNTDLNCSNCNKSFTTKSHVTRHFKIHSRISNVKRDLCDKKPQLKERKPKTMEYVCQICNKSFTRKDHLRRHMSVHDRKTVPPPPKIKKFNCPFCDTTVTTNSSLRRHISIHFRDSSLQRRKKINRRKSSSRKSINISCPVCNKKILKKSLKWHMLLHSDESPFKCNLCEYAGKRKDYCLRHYQRAHEKI